MKWYVIKVANGKEKKVKELIEAELKRKELNNLIINILVPSNKAQQLRNGKKINVEKIIIPGYIFVECDLVNEVAGFVKYIDGVQSLLTKPLRESEVNRLLDKTPSNDVVSDIDVFYIKEKVRIIDGPFNTFKGVIKNIDINKQKQKYKVAVNVFDREVILDLIGTQFIKDLD